MGDLDHARQLLLMAHKDLKALGGMMCGEPFDDEIFGLHAQQAAEKALKSWIALLGWEYPKTHNITLLLNVLQNHGADVNRFWPLEEYNIFAVQYRYEAFTATGGLLDRSDIIERTRELVDFIDGLIHKSEFD